MGERGPKKKPTKLELLQGRPGRRPINRKEPSPRAKAPRRPRWLSATAKAEWDAIAPELERIGLLTLVDGASFAAYCEVVSLFQRAQKALKKEKNLHYETDNGSKRPIPEIQILLDAARTIRAFAAEFGLTPSARARIEVEPPKELSKLKEFISDKAPSKKES